jgi:hypothetical protein
MARAGASRQASIRRDSYGLREKRESGLPRPLGCN